MHPPARANVITAVSLAVLRMVHLPPVVMEAKERERRVFQPHMGRLRWRDGRRLRADEMASARSMPCRNSLKHGLKIEEHRSVGIDEAFALPGYRLARQLGHPDRAVDRGRRRDFSIGPPLRHVGRALVGTTR